MKANELRIGNLVNYHDKVIDVKGIVRNTIYFGDKEECWDSNIGDYVAFTPIPLTEEWLLKFGYSVIERNTAGKIYGIVKIGHFINEDIRVVQFFQYKDAGKFFRRGLEIKHETLNTKH